MSADQPYDFIGDVHGMRATFEAMVARLGYARTGRGWRHPEGRRLVSVGDLLDRGPDSLGCVELLGEMIADGAAQGVLGNHEINALHFMAGLRPDNARNRQQFAATHRQIQADPKRWDAVVAIIERLPFRLELPEANIRVVHAHWHEELLASLPEDLSAPTTLRRTARGGDLHLAIERCLKGPEVTSPPWSDAEGHVRRRRRVPWWEDHPVDAPLTVFGHYWFPFRGERERYPAPTFLGPGQNAACLDWSVARGGPLVALRWPERTFFLQEAVEA